MRVILFNGINLSKLILPKNIDGSFSLKDDLNNDSVIANIEASNNHWIMKSNSNAKIYDNLNEVAEILLTPNSHFFIEYNNKKMFVYIESVYDNTIGYYSIKPNESLFIGNTTNNDIVYDIPFVFDNYIELTLSSNGWIVKKNQNAIIYINNVFMINEVKNLNFGDVIFCLGMRISLYNGIISINNPLGKVRLNASKLFKKNIKSEYDFNENVIISDEIKEEDLYNDEDYYFKKARLRRFIESYDLVVASPPKKQEKKDMPLLLTLGPMLTMGVMSITSLLNILLKILNDETDLESCWTTLLTSIAMLCTSLLWPNLTKAYQNKMLIIKEKERKSKYRAYVSRKEKEIKEERARQESILKENFMNLDECLNIINSKKINLWERRHDQKDFLSVRVGIGSIPIEININFTEEEFSLEEDELKKETEEILENLKMLYNVPIVYSFLNKKITAIMGNVDVFAFIDNIILQLVTFHSYDDLKLVFLVSNKNKGLWEKYKELPYCFSDDKKVRFFAVDDEEIKYVSSYLEQMFLERLMNAEREAVENENKEKSYSPNYLIFTDDYPTIRKMELTKMILKSKETFGFEFVCIENRMSKLPSECVDYIHLDRSVSTILCNDINNYKNISFKNEINSNINMENVIKVLSNIPIEFIDDTRYLPNSLGFLEMFNIGKVEQFNSLNRWRINNPVKSLRAQVGINDELKPIYLDLHEKYHGPHGLIAGTTGSGKSEFIITYILSMALNYSPNEVAFILIDYKGGGLAGAFENKTLGLKLPHLAGTITNLDKSSLNRTLVSIESELKRRQLKFNEERDRLAESTMDIYKYQKFFREGKISDPMPHLFIISDEFAELKSQQPEFMDDLISAARIGRSLGIHLILATQKPSGVVNDQIWSNTKFRVCLKVQDKADSNEMLKLPDAADITNVGRFYLQVGNNEIFVLGQSGWTGTAYLPSDIVKKNYDRSISVIDNVGNTVINIENIDKVKKITSSGDELSNVLKYLCNLAKRENVYTKKLWLDSINENIYVDDIVKKYNYSYPEVVTAVLGEYDAPSKQYQDLLTLRFDIEGNTLLYGLSTSYRENFISTLIYSLCTNYTANDINIYIVDYGSESLRMFANFPQLGDIVYASDNDKLIKLFSIINKEINNRKKLFANYNGDYSIYCKNSGSKVPLKLFIFNNYDSFKESNPSLEEMLIKFTREGARYGILFLISAINARSVYSKVSRNCAHTFVLDMSDRGDYVDILGKIGNVYPADYAGRGLFKTEDVYEFQTAQITVVDELVDFVNKKVEEVKLKSKFSAPNIPSLPDVLTIEMLDKYITTIDKLPIGIDKNTLKPVTYNFLNDVANVISSKDVLDCIDLLKTIIHSVRKLNNMIILIDTEKELSSIGGMVNTYVDRNFEDFILKLEKFLDDKIDGTNINVFCVIAGLSKFQESLNDKKFNGFLKGIKTFNNVKLIFVDSSYKLKKIGFESWYSSLINNSNGIWVGSGFAEQSVFNCSDMSSTYKIKVDRQYAWVIKKGESKLVKIVGEKKKDEE